MTESTAPPIVTADRPLRGVGRWLRLVALFGFVLPFMTVSCMGQEVVKPTGIELAFGLESEIAPEFAELGEMPDGDRQVESEVLAGLVVLVAAVVAGFAGTRRLATVLGVGAGAVLLYWWSQTTSDLPREAAFLLDVSVGLGLWIVWLLILAATTIDIVDYMGARRETPA